MNGTPARHREGANSATSHSHRVADRPTLYALPDVNYPQEEFASRGVNV